MSNTPTEFRYQPIFEHSADPTEYRRLTDQFGLSPNRKLKAFSKGMRAKVALSLAMANEPELLVLDGPMVCNQIPHITSKYLSITVLVLKPSTLSVMIVIATQS